MTPTRFSAVDETLENGDFELLAWKVFHLGHFLAISEILLAWMFHLYMFHFRLISEIPDYFMSETNAVKSEQTTPAQLHVSSEQIFNNTFLLWSALYF